MKALLIALVTLHALIHLMGFAKAFRLAEIAALHQPISRGMGMVWLLAALALLATAALLALSSREWWMPAATAVVLSQLAIVTSWGDAKFGTIANAIMVIALALAAADRRSGSLRSRYDRDVAALFAPASAPSLVTEAELARVPPLVQTYLRRAGVLGRPHVHDLTVRFEGQLRNGENSPWMNIRAEQRERFGASTARLFLVDGAMYGVPFRAYHRFVGPTATMEVHAASLFPIVDARGPEMDRSEAVTLLNDMCVLAPATLLDPAIGWTTLDARRVRATFRSISAELVFDEAGDLVTFVSHDRLMSADGKTFLPYPWSTPLRDYREFAGARIASYGEAIWSLPGGPFVYARFTVAELRYNVAATTTFGARPQLSSTAGH